MTFDTIQTACDCGCMDKFKHHKQREAFRKAFLKFIEKQSSKYHKRNVLILLETSDYIKDFFRTLGDKKP